jgi:hypothetical protein
MNRSTKLLLTEHFEDFQRQQVIEEMFLDKKAPYRI